jgi:hypothetical protein
MALTGAQTSNRSPAAERSGGRRGAGEGNDLDVQSMFLEGLGEMGAPEQAEIHHRHETMTASEPSRLIAELRHHTQPSSRLVGSE